ncbi:uncharacterized protein LOC133924037 isoform X2 [Phragmites australis]|uniref:uncharacterized protein LOC133924037 isoform X2 n=1 Tax=Phragmites australis TaxID=29695 RepID=UPI002D7979A4|nr:uncharacterized protein LOC133924037 isoform X2 [Phragmites australis]XP_062225386.1 uncharacterized protein LOC133924037 isoform X2 [Phragmites australis]
MEMHTLWCINYSDCDVCTCDYYPEGGGCMILLAKSLYECHNDSDLKNVLLHEMIHAYICIKDNNNNHSDHGAKFQKLMNTINLSSVADPHRPVGGYCITVLHEIRKKYYHYKCERCGDLVKSVKIRGPSHDDCIERIGANDHVPACIMPAGPTPSCQNSKCHWHRHKKWCSGSYCSVQESSLGSLKLKPSKAEEALDGGKAEEPACKSWHPTPTSNKNGLSNKNEREGASSEFLDRIDSPVGCSGLDSSSRDRSKKLKLSKDVSFDLQTAETVQEAPKRPRTAAVQYQERSRRQKRKLRNWDGSYSVIIEWLNYYCVSESDEDEVPLINKRTERRKRQKWHEISLVRESSNGVECASSTSHTVNGTKDGCVSSCSLDPGDNSELVIVSGSQPEERLLPNHAVGTRGVSGNQAGHEAVSCPLDLDSPIRGEVVDISDG